MELHLLNPQIKGADIAAYMKGLGYFEKRILITNALHNRDISAPFSKKEIIEFARKEAATGYFNASYSALAGYDNDLVLVGKPAVNPETGEANTAAEQSGLIDKAAAAANGAFFKMSFMIVAAITLILLARGKL